MISIHLSFMPMLVLGVLWTRHSIGLVVACFAIELEWSDS